MSLIESCVANHANIHSQFFKFFLFFIFQLKIFSENIIWLYSFPDPHPTQLRVLSLSMAFPKKKEWKSKINKQKQDKNNK